MRYPSIKTLETRLNLDRETAKQVRGLLDGSIDPETVPACKRWFRECYNPPSEDELIMFAVDAVLGNCGVEDLGAPLGRFYRFAPQFCYSNTGDTYADTVMIDNETGRFFIASCGYMVERGKVRED